jgi:hypothetical protein
MLKKFEGFADYFLISSQSNYHGAPNTGIILGRGGPGGLGWGSTDAIVSDQIIVVHLMCKSGEQLQTFGFNSPGVAVNTGQRPNDGWFRLHEWLDLTTRHPDRPDT